MQGQVLNYDTMTATGLISGEGGRRFTFSGSEWRGNPQQLRVGARVDFDADGTEAFEIYVVPGGNGGNPLAAGGAYEKSPIVAGLLAFFLGGFGAHKFYLGYNKEGAILLCGTLVSWVLMIVVIGVFGLIAIGIVCLIETIIYITKSPDDFQATYVDGYRPWF